MTQIRIDSEAELVEAIRASHSYKDFRDRRLGKKIKREQETWNRLQEHQNAYTQEILNAVFDKVDFEEPNQRWFGVLLATPNRNRIFESPLDRINKWFSELLFSGQDAGKALNACMTTLKIKGASKGLATLLLYLSDPKKYNIWVDKTHDGLLVLGRVEDLKGTSWDSNYLKFNLSAIQFRDAFGFVPQEIDWILSFIASWVESEDGHFLVDDETLKTDVVVSVDDESGLDEVFGDPMDLRVMRWSPTNEMGVVALFIEFRHDLGFPIIDFIRTQFPDASAFEKSGQRHVRRYIEFEFRSSGYKSHLKSKRKCDYVVCWEHDWKDCPIPAIELRTQIPIVLAKTKARK